MIIGEYIGPSIHSQGTKPCRVNVAASGKAVEPLGLDQAETAVKEVKQQESVQDQRDEKLKIWMNNIKEFIRNIDVKSL